MVKDPNGGTGILYAGEVLTHPGCRTGIHNDDVVDLLSGNIPRLEKIKIIVVEIAHILRRRMNPAAPDKPEAGK
jgi:hypothetical protein